MRSDRPDEVNGCMHRRSRVHVGVVAVRHAEADVVGGEKQVAAPRECRTDQQPDEPPEDGASDRVGFVPFSQSTDAPAR